MPPKKSFSKKRGTETEPDSPCKRAKTGSKLGASQATRSLFDLPREIRDQIYGYVLGTGQTTSQNQALLPISAKNAQWRRALVEQKKQAKLTLEKSSRHSGVRGGIRAVGNYESAKKSSELNPPPLDSDIMRTCKKIRAEVNEYIFDKVPVKLTFNTTTGFEPQQLALIKLARCLKLKCSAVLNWIDLESPNTAGWATQLRQTLETRDDIKEFEFVGEAFFKDSIDSIFELAMKHNLQSMTTIRAYLAIMRILKDLPNIKVKKSIQIKWDGQDNLPLNHHLLTEYWNLIKGLNQQH